MKKLVSEISAIDTWFLRRLLLEDNKLSLTISEGIVTEKEELFEAEEGKHIGPVRKILPNSKSKHFLIEFNDLISFQRTSESYVWAPDHRCKIKGLFGATLDSSYLDYVKRTNLASQIINEPFHHWHLCCVFDIVDIITTEDPVITVLKEKDISALADISNSLHSKSSTEK